MQKNKSFMGWDRDIHVICGVHISNDHPLITAHSDEGKEYDIAVFDGVDRDDET